MIEAVGLTKRFGAKTAVDDLSFQVRPGAVTGFLGPNGSGKSTTMRMILGLDRPTAGHVTINGHPYRSLPNAPRLVGALLDAKGVHGGRTARNHLLSLAQLAGIPAPRVDEVLGVVGLRDVAKRRTSGFSLGMGQRLGIAAALLGDPQVLLFDEPVNGLDPEGIHWVRNLMKMLAAEGRTVFVSSHLMSEMALTADHLIVIGRGRLLSDMSVKDFISANSADFARVRVPEDGPEDRQKLTATLIEAGGRVLSEPGGALRVTGLPLPRISELAHGCDVRLWELSPHQASLEEAYMRLTQGLVDYRSTEDAKEALAEPPPLDAYGYPLGSAGPVPAEPVEVPQEGWFAPPPPGGPGPAGFAPPPGGPGPAAVPGGPSPVGAPAASSPAAPAAGTCAAPAAGAPAVETPAASSAEPASAPAAGTSAAAGAPASRTPAVETSSAVAAGEQTSKDPR
ncbi:ABC transporter ATP-binding protein [Streptomyces californicus]|uniref:ABC transporter ATP-binding protein n=2 Tax=Streptomyces californicus TaxID=67351 RepID=UPI001E4F4EED|nr:ABC transporter ATP-binding protein [Streptomyces californicus]MCC0577071.1 ABC transporter ATP-binding protein [Streptomyces californicus]